MGLSSLAGSCSPASGHFKAADSDADPATSFGALLKLERYARIDLGAIIDLPWRASRDCNLAADDDGSAIPSSLGRHCAATKSNMGQTKSPSCLASRRR
jgi:hypothetical protein